MSVRTARRLQILLMIWVTTIFLTAWLPFLRSMMDGPSYEWGATLFGRQFSGNGLAGDYWYPVLKAAIGLSLLYGGWRRPDGLVRVALVGWLTLSLADTLYSVATSPENFRFRGDTLGIDLSLVLIAPALDATMLALAIWWAARAPALGQAPMSMTNHVMLGTAALLLPVQYLLLSSASGHDTPDVLGVLLTLTQWALISAGLAPWGGRGTSARTAFNAT
jgi:hypothetical protein